MTTITGQVYVCSCGRTYTSPLPLLAPPICSGGHKNRPKHTPKNMTLKGTSS